MLREMDPRVNEILANPKNKVSPGSSILNTKRDPDSTTDKYSETDDIGAVQVLNRYGWHIADYKEVPVRSKRQGFQRYCATFENDDLNFTHNKGKARIIQIGGHDGTTRLQLHAGFLTFACSNGLVCGDKVFEPVKIKHIGNQPLSLEKIVNDFAEASPRVFRKVEQMQHKELSQAQANHFASEGAKLRFEDKFSVETADILKVRREADDGLNLWQVFNRVQENLLVPANDFKMVTANRKERKVKQLKSIDANLKINQGLWQLAEEFLN